VRVGGTTLLAVVLLLVGAVTATAQDDGVFIDPDSPTAKQYRLPVESAREQANPEGGKLVPPGARPTGATAAPLFGEGIATAAGAGSRSKGGKKSSSRTKRSTEKAGTPSSPTADDEQKNSSPLTAAVQNPGAPSGGVGAPLLIAGGAALILLIGSVVGVLLRRRRAG